MSSENLLPQGREDDGRSAGGRRNIFDALRIRNFRWYWISTLSFFSALQLQFIAQAWLAYELTHSPLKLGLVSATFGVPNCIFSPLGGVIGDRVGRRRVIMAAQAVTGTVMLVLAILITTGLIQYWHLLIGALINGTSFAFIMPCQQALVAGMVPRDKLYNAIALNSGAMNITRVGGPALAGALIGFIGTGSVFYFALGFYLIAAASMFVVHEQHRVNAGAGKSALLELTEGLNYMRRHSVILLLLCMDFAITILGMPFQSLMPVFAELLEVQALGYGFLMAMVGIGALAGSLSIASLGHFRSKGKLMLVAGIIFGLVLTIFANSPLFGKVLGMGQKTFYLASFLLMLTGAACTCYTSTSATLIQINITDEVRGRVLGLYGMVFGLMPIGSLLAGAVAEEIGAPFAITAGGSILAIFMLIMTLTNQRVKRLE